jgi:hypothetical protein
MWLYLQLTYLPSSYFVPVEIMERNRHWRVKLFKVSSWLQHPKETKHENSSQNIILFAQSNFNFNYNLLNILRVNVTLEVAELHTHTHV